MVRYYTTIKVRQGIIGFTSDNNIDNIKERIAAMKLDFIELIDTTIIKDEH